jgi:L-alanine-DL-glutamate epimerase-like enolase superfamily enzyme
MMQAIDAVETCVLVLPTELGPETDGTAVWRETAMVLALVQAGGVTGIGYSYVTAAAARVIDDVLAREVIGTDAFAIPTARAKMLRAIRNHGRDGIGACAISAVDIALWDLKAKLLGVALADLLGAARTVVPVYASGGFTSQNADELADELAGYVAAGHRRVKIKVGSDPRHDAERVARARAAIGPGVELMVDANGAYTRKQALALAEHFAEAGVVYFEEPVSADDLDGLRLLRDRAPMAIAAGEYGYNPMAFHRLADCVDIVQADATRALGITGFLEADALCAARCLPLSSHCAPALHAHAGAAATQLVHLEYFRDHARMEARVFDGALPVIAGGIAYERTRPGLGLELRAREVARLAA